MYKDILVHIPTERPIRPVIDGSISLAAGLNAHLDAVAVGYVATSAAYIMEGGAAVAAVFEMERESAVERAEAALAVFKSKAMNAGISYTCHPLGAMPGDAVGLLGEMARLHDLSIVLQPDPAQGSLDNDVPREILFQAGGPVLFLPYTFRGAFKAKRIGICWDGSRLAARAMRDAAPFLARAEEIVIIAINETDMVPEEVSTRNLARHLGRRGLSTRTVNLSAARSDIQPTMLSLAADENLDLLIMGGYGHSRLQERFLGGVTRAMLEAMTVPTLMSHDRGLIQVGPVTSLVVRADNRVLERCRRRQVQVIFEQVGPSRRGGSLPRRGLDAVLVLLRIARVEMRLEFDFGEMFEMFGLAEQFPALERPVGGLLTTEGR
jgi:nucleotide-binding universal stress UspA family protein